MLLVVGMTRIAPLPPFVQVSHCHDCVLYVLATVEYVTIVGCSDSILLLGAVGKVIPSPPPTCPSSIHSR